MITIPLVICVVGLLIYLLVDPSLRNGRVLEVGRIMFFAGLLVTLAGAATRALL